jgi:hypothetical protein
VEGTQKNLRSFLQAAEWAVTLTLLLEDFACGRTPQSALFPVLSQPDKRSTGRPNKPKKRLLS